MKIELAKDAPNWHRLWSVRLALLASILSTLEVVVKLWEPIVPEGVFLVMSVFAATGSAIARNIKQHLEDIS